MVMLRGYIDESGNDGKSSFLILGGYILPADKWMDFSREWKRILATKPEIKYFHAVDAESGEGAFEGISEPFRRMKTLDLLSVIERHNPVGLLCWISFEDWEEFLLPRIRSGFADAYYPLFDWTVKEIWKYHLVAGITECSTSFVFDDCTDTKLKSNLVKMHDAIRQETGVPQLSAMLGTSPDFEDDKIVAPLQAADLLVWHKRRELSFPDEKREMHKRLAATVHFSQALNASYIADFG